MVIRCRCGAELTPLAKPERVRCSSCGRTNVLFTAGVFRSYCRHGVVDSETCERCDVVGDANAIFGRPR